MKRCGIRNGTRKGNERNQWLDVLQRRATETQNHTTLKVTYIQIRCWSIGEHTTNTVIMYIKKAQKFFAHSILFPFIQFLQSKSEIDTKCNLAVPRMRTAYDQTSFAFRGGKAWNKLDLEMKLAPSIQSFKTRLKALN